jgi:hypothetical protein
LTTLISAGINAVLKATDEAAKQGGFSFDEIMNRGVTT